MKNMSEKAIILRICLSKNEFNSNQKTREKIDNFTTAVNDKLCDRLKEEVLFDADFIDDNTMIFTIDQGKYINETNKIVEKFLSNKKFSFISNRLCQTEVCEIIC